MQEPSRPARPSPPVRSEKPRNPPQRHSGKGGRGNAAGGSHGGGGGSGGGRPSSGGKPHHSGPVMPATLQAVEEAAREVLREVGGHAPHSFYRQALGQLISGTAGYRQGLTGTLRHRDQKAAELSADFSLENEFLVNVHCREEGFSHADVAKMTSAIKFFGHRHGLLVNFGGGEVHTRKLTAPHEPLPDLTQDELLAGAPEDPADRMQASMLVRSLLRVARANQLGFDAAVWRGLMQAELTAEGLPNATVKPVPMQFRGQELGNLSAQGFFDFHGRGLVYVTALQERLKETDLTTVRHFLKGTRRPWALVLHFGRRRLEWKWLHLRKV